MTPDEMAEGRRERKKAQTRDALEAAAWRLFLRKGFEATTVEDITDAADVSPRTFFRYFPSKEAVLYAEKDRDLVRLRTALLSRPAAEAPLEALEQALHSLADDYEESRERHLVRARLALGAPAVASYSRHEMRAQFEDGLTEAMAERLGVDPQADLRPRLLAGAAMAVVTTAGMRWIAGDGREHFPDLVTEAFSLLRTEVAPQRVGSRR